MTKTYAFKKSLLQKIIEAQPIVDLSGQFSRYACVAMMIKDLDSRPELAFIKRAERANDNWSGQLAFPGGKKDPQDPSDLDSVLREVSEEVGYCLSKQYWVANLNSLQGRSRGQLLPFYLQPFVFAIDREEELGTLCLQASEVSRFYWIPFGHLLDYKNHSVIEYQHNSLDLKLPAILFPDGEKLWGLTYMILTDFLKRISTHPEGHLLFGGPLDLTRWREYEKYSPG